jgi:hypothetical protein
VQIHILGRGYRLARHVLHEFKVSFSLEAASEGPWHQVGEWDDWLGNRREDEAAFHSIAECGPCESMCNECYRDLEFLRVYGERTMSSDGDGFIF